MVYPDRSFCVDQIAKMHNYSIKDVRRLRKEKDYTAAYQILSDYQGYGITRESALLEKAVLLSDENKLNESCEPLEELLLASNQYRKIAKYRLVRLYARRSDNDRYDAFMKEEFLHDVLPYLREVTGKKEIQTELITPLAGGHIIASRIHSCDNVQIFEKVRRKDPSTDNETLMNKLLTAAESGYQEVSPTFWGEYESEDYVSMFFDNIDPVKIEIGSDTRTYCEMISRYHRNISIPESTMPSNTEPDILLNRAGRPSIRTMKDMSNGIGHNLELTKQLSDLGITTANTLNSTSMEQFFKHILTMDKDNLLTSNPVVVQHGDINKTNILYSRQFEKPYLIDWEISGFGYFGYDYGYLLSNQNLQFRDLLETCCYIKQFYDDEYANPLYAILFFYLICISFIRPGWVEGVGRESFDKTVALVLSLSD